MKKATKGLLVGGAFALVALVALQTWRRYQALAGGGAGDGGGFVTNADVAVPGLAGGQQRLADGSYAGTGDAVYGSLWSPPAPPGPNGAPPAPASAPAADLGPRRGIQPVYQTTAPPGVYSMSSRSGIPATPSRSVSL